MQGSQSCGQLYVLFLHRRPPPPRRCTVMLLLPGRWVLHGIDIAGLGSTLSLPQMHGYAEIQEVPRDNSRQANRTMFSWYCSVERASAQQLDNAYKAMLRCLQVCEVQRRAHQDVGNSVVPCQSNKS